MRKLRAINDGAGIGLLGDERDLLAEVRIYPEGGSILLVAETRTGEAMQYLNAREAMAFSVWLRKMAIDALEAEAHVIP